MAELPAAPAACAKLSLSRSQARAVVLAAATYYRHNPRRQERAIYYCQRCEAWHTTSHDDAAPTPARP